MKKIALLTSDPGIYRNFAMQSEFSDTELIIIDVDHPFATEKLQGIILDGVIVQCHIEKYIVGHEGKAYTGRYEIYQFCMSRQQKYK